MTRYFYTDPLKAAWMAREHGLNLVNGFDVERIPDKWREAYQKESLFAYDADDILSTCIEYKEGVRLDKFGKFIIHPDCHAMLEPQVGDLVHIVRGFVSYYKEVQDVAKNKGKTTGIWSGGEHWDVDSKEPLHDFEIIQRNGKAWFTPEREEV